MNYRLLVANPPPPGDPERTSLVATISGMVSETPETLESRLTETTPWLLDLPTQAEAKRLQQWLAASSRIKVTVAPSVGPPAPSRAAAIAFVERELSGKKADAEARARATAEDHARRQAEGKLRAQQLAEQRRIDPAGIARRNEVTASGERPALDLSKPPESPPAPRRLPLIVAAAVIVALGLLLLSRCASAAEAPAAPAIPCG